VTPYWILFVLPAFVTLQKRDVSGDAWKALFVILVLFIGLRYQVGGDWGSYATILDRVSLISIWDILTDKEPGYYLLSKISDNLVGSVWLVNVCAGMIFSAGLIRFLRSLPDPLLGLVVAIPYMVIVLSMGYTRQAMAFGLLLWGLVYLKNNRVLPFVLTICVAATFHMSAVILLPLAALANAKNRVWTGFWVGLATILMYMLFLQERSDQLWQNYVVADYGQKSQGGAVRVAMNALPAILFLSFRRRFRMTPSEKKLWFWVAILCLVSFLLVFEAPTAVDRVALYFMPIQLLVLTHLPGIFHAHNRPFIRLAIVAGYGLVQFVWLGYAQHAGAWLPYRFWPLVSST